jgi:uncharacterized membrane protein YfhO
VFAIIRFKDKGLVILALLFFCTIGLYIIRNGFLGANTDWMSQHTVLPDYFRKLFYETGDLLPNYAPNLGAGQNLYNFSYYGFLSPIILVSYLLPFVKMPIYIMTVSLISLAVSGLLFYNWLSAKGFPCFITVSVSMIFLLAAPMLYHTYKQIVFVNYMPFLCLTLIGIDRYFKTGRRGFLIVSAFMMIMSSFYFSVSGLLASSLYWISADLSNTENFKVRDLIKSGVRFMISIITAVLMAGVLLIPTFASILGAHRECQTDLPLYRLLVPQFKLLRYVYSPYGIGLTSIVITVLLMSLFYKKRSEQVLAFGIILITAFPGFLFLLNGGLYIADKMLIPFLPIACYLIALFFYKLERKELPQGKTWIFFFVTALLTVISAEQMIYRLIFFADGLLMLFLYFIYLRRGTVKLLVISVIVVLLVMDFVIQDPEKLVKRDIYREVFDDNIKEAMEEVNRDDPSFYRMDSFLNKDNNLNRVNTENQYLTSFYSSCFQKDYFDFRNDVFQLERPYRNYMMQPASQNPLFLAFMGVKYVHSDYAPAGYELYKEKGNVKIYRNENVFPIGYVTNNIISEKELTDYRFPFRQELLLHYTALTDHSAQGDNAAEAVNFHSEIQPTALTLHELKGKDFSLTSDHNVCRITAKTETEGSISLSRPAAEDEVLFLEMKVKNLTAMQDISVTIQKERNRLSAADHIYYNKNTVFHFAVSVRKGDMTLPVTYSAGEYELSSLRGYTLNVSKISPERKSGSFKVSSIKTHGDVISGSVMVLENGYFITTIPYDSNFTVLIDGQAIRYEKVNTAFIGFPIEKGHHQIVFRYLSPGFPIGVAASLTGFLMFLFILLTERSVRRLKFKTDKSSKL